MIRGLQGEEWKFIQKYLKEKISHGVGGTEENFHHAWAVRMLCECCASFAQASHKLKVLCEFQGVVRISHKPGAVVIRRPYLPHFSSKSYTVWSVGFLTSWALKWYITCRKWTSGSAPKVRRKIAAVVLCFLHSVCFSSLLLSFTWLVLMIQKAVKTLKLAKNMIRSHC